MSAYPKMSPAVIAWVRKRELEAYRNFHGERVELRAAVNGQPNGYAPVSEAELQAEYVLQLV